MAEFFIFYKSVYDAVTGSGMDESDQLKTLLALCKYGLYDEETELSGFPYGLFTIAKANIDASKRKQAAGRKGGRPPKGNTLPAPEKPAAEPAESLVSEGEKAMFPEEESTNTNTITNTNTNTITDTITDTDTTTTANANTNTTTNTYTSQGARPRAQSAFAPPTMEELRAYCRSRNNNINPEHWMDYYTANGWMVGKNPMQDWKAAVRSWEGNQIGVNPSRSAPPRRVTGPVPYSPPSLSQQEKAQRDLEENQRQLQRLLDSLP